MSSRRDAAKVLRHLAKTLDVEETLAAFPGWTRESLGYLLRAMAARVQPPTTTAVLSVDGAARGNPGEAGAGVVLQTPDGAVLRMGEYLGEATNNTAEYKALLAGMKKAADLGIREMQVRSDSELMIKQLNGLYKVKSPHLQDLYFSVIKAISAFDRVTFEHIPREENREADRMANLAIDAKDTVTL
ncbi:MAG: ribonuclease HI family protein [bacterium]|nr:MAG: ribonuclease HI family protein [bacterium]